MLTPTSPGDPDPDITALRHELKQAAAPCNISASVIPQTHSDPPSDKAETGTIETVPPTQEEHKDLFSILIDPLATVKKKSNMLDPLRPDPLQPVSPQDWINMIQRDPEGFRAILMATATQGIAPAAPAPAPAQPANAPRPILFRSNKADTPWQHDYISGTTIGATICMEACKAFILKPWQTPTNNVTVKMVNNFLDRIQNTCKDLAIYRTQIIQIRTTDGEHHNLLSDYNNIKLSDVCNAIQMLHNVKEDKLQDNRDRLLAAQMIARDQIFCNSIMISVHHDMINDLLLLSRAVLLYRILMHIKVVLLDSMLAVKCIHQKLSETALLLAGFAKGVPRHPEAARAHHQSPEVDQQRAATVDDNLHAQGLPADQHRAQLVIVHHDSAERENDRHSSHAHAAHPAGQQNICQSQGA
jgi:hypothetical protein